MQNILKAIAAALSAAAVIALQSLLEFFSGAAPADVNVMIWAVVGAVGVLAVNFAIGKLPRP